MYAHTSVHLYAHVRSLVRSHVHSSVHSFALRSSPRPLTTRTPYVHRVSWSYKSIVYEAFKKNIYIYIFMYITYIYISDVDLFHHRSYQWDPWNTILDAIRGRMRSHHPALRGSCWDHGMPGSSLLFIFGESRIARILTFDGRWMFQTTVLFLLDENTVIVETHLPFVWTWFDIAWYCTLTYNNASPDSAVLPLKW